MLKNPIKKRLLRDFKQNIVRYLAIALVFVTMVAVIGGFLVAANGNKRGLDQGTVDCIREDGNFSLDNTVSADIVDGVVRDIEKLGVSVVPQHYYEYEYDQLFTLRIFANRTQFNLPKLHEGKLPEATDEIAIDGLYAQNNGWKTGDTFNVDEKEFKIVGLIWLPDYTSPYKNNSDILMDATHFGVAVVAATAFEGFDGEITHSYAYRFDDIELTGDEKFDLSKDIKTVIITNGVALTSFLTAEENQAISFVNNDFGNDVPMMKGFLLAMMTILAFIFAIIIDHTITSEAASIGALAATGMRRRELIRHYLALPLLVTVLSAIVGSVICLTLSYKIFNNMYHSAYSLPPLSSLFDIEAILYTTALPIVAMLIINLFFLVKRLSIMPIRFLRGEIGRKKSQRGMRLPNFKFIARFRLRTILSNKGSYAMLFVGIFFANFILMLGLVLAPSIDGYIKDVEHNAAAQYQYILKMPADPLKGQQGAEKFSIRAAEYYDNGAAQSYEVSILGITDGSKYLSEISLTADGVIVSEGFWKKYKLSVGDEITLTDCATNNKYGVTVKGYYPYSAGYAVFMPIVDMNSLVDNPVDYWNGWFSDELLDFDDDAVATVITPDVLRGAGEQMLTTFSGLMNICLLAAVVVHLVLFVLLTKLIVDKNAHNISLMKIFGYNNRELNNIFLHTTTAMVVLSLVVSLPLAKIGITALFTEMMFRKMSGYLNILAPWWVYATALALGVATYCLVNLLNMRKITNIPMAQALKVRE
jgi:putative ABC transport system permease protein